MYAELLSWLAPLLGLACFWYSLRYPWGWLVGATQSVVYAALGVLTHEWGLVGLTPVYMTIFIRNYMHDHRKALKKARKRAKKLAAIEKVA